MAGQVDDTLPDRAAVRELVEAYAQRADRADGERAAELFTPDATLTVYITPEAPEPTSVRRGRADIAEALDSVRRYRTALHIIASHTSTVTGDRADGETRCIAHHVYGEAGAERDRVLFIRYQDQFVRDGGRWLIAARELRVDAVTDRPLRSE